MNVRQKHGIKKLIEALTAAKNKENGITGNMEAIREKLKPIMDAVEHPVPNRVIDDE
jgi:hypothetical protein